MQAQPAELSTASLQALKQRAHQLLESQRSLQQQNQALAAERLAFQSERDQLAIQYQELSAERDALQAERDSLTAHLQELTTQRDSIQQQWETLQTAVEELQGQLTVQSAQSEEQSQQREVLQGRVEELQGQLSMQSAQTEGPGERSEALRAQFEEPEEQLKITKLDKSFKAKEFQSLKAINPVSAEYLSNAADKCESQTYLEGVSNDLVHEVLTIVAANNLQAHYRYANAFETLSDERIAEIDLIRCDLKLNSNHREISAPLLLNGSNSYQDLRQKVSSLDIRKAEVLLGSSPDSIIVIPEPQTLLELALNSRSKSRISLPLGGNAYRQVVRDLMAFGYGSSQAFINQVSKYNLCDLLRIYDSHLSCFSYIIALSSVLNELGFSSFNIDRLAYYGKDYSPDLASRFSGDSTMAHFFSTINGRESQKGARKRDISVSSSNPDPLFPQSLLILGDSHSYSAIAPLASQLFAKTFFHWSDHREYPGLIESFKKSHRNGLVICEMTERFFLRNFGCI